MWPTEFQKLLKTTSKKSLTQFFLGYLQVKSKKNISKEHHNVNNIFAYLQVTENTLSLWQYLLFLVSMRDFIFEYGVNTISINKIYSMGGFRPSYVFIPLGFFS